MAIAQLLQALTRNRPVMGNPMALPMGVSAGLNLPPADAMPSMGGMEPKTEGLNTRLGNAYDSEINDLYGQSDRLEGEAMNHEIPARRGLRPGQLGLGAVAAIIAHAMGDRNQDFMRGALATVESQIEKKHQEDLAKLDQKTKQKLLMARQAAQRAERLEAMRRHQEQMASNQQRMDEDKRQFDETLRLNRDKLEAKTPPEVVNALKTITSEKADPVAIGAALDIIDQHRVGQGLPPFTKEQRDQYTKKRYVQADKEGDNARADRALDQKMKRNQAYFEMNKAKMQQMLVKNGLDQARTQQILQKVAYYDREFQLKAANINSQIARRDALNQGKPEDQGKALKALYDLNERQIKKWESEMPGGVFGAAHPNAMKVAELKIENAKLLKQMSGLAKQKTIAAVPGASPNSPMKVNVPADWGGPPPPGYSGKAPTSGKTRTGSSFTYKRN